jgi:hypothetical protein
VKSQTTTEIKSMQATALSVLHSLELHGHNSTATLEILSYAVGVACSMWFSGVHGEFAQMEIGETERLDESSGVFYEL